MNRAHDDKEEIRSCFRQKATTERYATSPDFHLREVEIEFLSRRLGDSLRVLDVGCGNGYSTLRFAEAFRSDFVGIDFVPEMIDAARDIRKEFSLKGSISFDVGDATNLNFPDASFDVVISQRCLLNLPSPQDQWKALEEISRVLKPRGRYLMLEGTLQGLQKLNEVRGQFGLAPIPETDKHNPYSKKFDEPEMLDRARKVFSEVEAIDRFGMYYFLSRVVHPLLVAPEQPKYDAKINAVARQICSRIPNFQDIGHVALFVFRK
jgi:ubiquinone/menaquinone biosynthesis C-methylase UbiE